jgi:acyl-CoA synthetase (NDP forming)
MSLALQKNLNSLFRARSVALVGATEKSQWCQILIGTLGASRYSGKLFLINPKGGEVFGRSAYLSCRAVGEPIDLAVVMVPAAAVIGALEDIAAAGTRNAVVLTSGFSELGENGARLQQQLVDVAGALGLTLLGPNSLGFINFVDNVPVMVMPPMVRRSGPVAVVSQSGATAGAIMSMAEQTGVGLSYVVTLGNEAMVGLGDVLDFLIEDMSTRSIIVFAESIRDPLAFIAAAARAHAVRKPIVILKVGASELTAQVAQAHTGALVGDDRVFGAACRQMGLLRVDCLEDLVQTAALLAYTGPIAQRGLGLASISGGACEMVADNAERCGLRLPQFGADTLAALRGVLSEIGASTHNPLDVTGAAVAKPEMFEHVVGIVGRDPQIGLTASIFGLPTEAGPMLQFNTKTLSHIARGIAASGKPGVLLTQTVQPVNEVSLRVMRESGLPFALCGLRDGVQAIGHAFAWSAALERPAFAPLPSGTAAAVRPRSERETLDFLASRGVPVIPAAICTSAEQAVVAGRQAGGPVVLKIASPDIAHKTEAGGVLLNLSGDAAVAEGYACILANVAQAQPRARIDGVIVSPMRAKGTELFVGIARDPQWGLVLAVALGGIWVEALQDSSLRLLPVDAAEIALMFKELKAAKILGGFRGQPAVDLDAVSQVVAKIAAAAVALGPDLVSLEVNPLQVGADGRIECLDALAIWNEPTGN